MRKLASQSVLVGTFGGPTASASSNQSPQPPGELLAVELNREELKVVDKKRAAVSGKGPVLTRGESSGQARLIDAELPRVRPTSKR